MIRNERTIKENELHNGMSRKSLERNKPQGLEAEALSVKAAKMEERALTLQAVF